MKTHVFVGPPGSGKTTRLLQVIDTEVAAGTPLERLAVLTFTRAARKEVLDRLQRNYSVAVDSVPYVRTIHSAALRLIRADGFTVLSDDDWDEFAGRYGYEFTRQHERFEDIPTPPRLS